MRARFGLPDFTGQLFLHAIGAAGHDVVKYALDTFGTAEGSAVGASLSSTHDANAWPSDRYAGLPAPREDEQVVLWLQNSHAVPIPAGAVALDRMGAEAPVALDQTVGPFATVAVDVAALLPDLRWPAQIELRAGRHVVRPRYEVTRAGRTRIAHVNVERADLRPDPAIPALPPALGRGFLLPFPVLDPARFRTLVQPTPMAVAQADLPVRLDLFDTAGQPVAQRFLGRLPRDHGLALDLDTIPGLCAGHAELVYDVRDGGGADGWLHALFRWEHRESGHAAESSFGAHVFNTIMTWRDEPQSYSGPPPGLSTRLFLRLGRAGAAELRGADLPGLRALGGAVRHDLGAARRDGAADRGRTAGDRLRRVGAGAAGGGVRRGGAGARRGGGIRARAGHDMPAVRICGAGGPGGRVLARPHVRVLSRADTGGLAGPATMRAPDDDAMTAGVPAGAISRPGGFSVQDCASGDSTMQAL